MNKFIANRQRIIDRQTETPEYEQIEDRMPHVDIEEVRLTEDEKQALKEKFLKHVRRDNDRHRL